MLNLDDELEKKRVIEKMRRDEELEKMVNTIRQRRLYGHGQYLNIAHQPNSFVNGSGSPFSGVSLLSTEHSSYPSSSCFSNNGFCLSEDSSPTSFTFNADAADGLIKCKTPSVTDYYVNGLSMDSQPTDYFNLRQKVNVNERIDDLCQGFCRINVGEEQKDHRSIRRKRLEMEPNEVGLGFGYGYVPLDGTVPCNVEKYTTFDGFNNIAFDCQGFGAPPGAVSRTYDDDIKSVLLGFGGGYGEGELKGSNYSYTQCDDLRSDPYYDCVFGQRKEPGRAWTNSGVQLQNPSRSRAYLTDALVGSQRVGVDSNGDNGVTNKFISTQLIQPELGLDLKNLLYNRSMLKERTITIPKNRDSEFHVPTNRGRAIDVFDFEDSFITQGKSVNGRERDSLGGFKKNNLNEIARNPPEKISKLDGSAWNGGLCENGQNLVHSISSSLAEVRGYIHLMAKDQNGCRFLQRVFDEGTFLDVQIIFNEVIDDIVELMMEQFGNYLVQKLLNVCTEEQRMQIVLMVTKEPGQLVRICLNAYGTRVVQKLIETLKTRQQISLVKAALEPGFLDLIKDLNGNHVLQRCLQCLRNEDNEFIFDAAANFCVDIATHQHGCCVLQRCIAHSTGEHRDRLITEISNNGLILAQDPFGNYVVQYIIELRIPSVTANLLSQFKGRYIHLSMQKFSSHVVEKCLKHFGESRSEIVHELLSMPHFEQLLQDPFANYVIQSALAFTKGPLHAALVEAARPHSILRTSPYCKRIFSRNLSKK